MKPHVDYSLYLVTDSTAAILGTRDLIEVVGLALQGGASSLQSSFLTLLHPTSSHTGTWPYHGPTTRTDHDSM